MTDIKKSTKTLYRHDHSVSLHVQFHSNQHTHTLSLSLARSRNCGWWFPYRPVVTVSGGDRARAHTETEGDAVHASRHILYLCMYNSKVHSHMHSVGCAKMGHLVVAQRRSSGHSE